MFTGSFIPFDLFDWPPQSISDLQRGGVFRVFLGEPAEKGLRMYPKSKGDFVGGEIDCLLGE